MSTQVTVAVIPDCDICIAGGRGPRPAVYDGKTLRGPWAYMCEDCWQCNGVGQLGTGFGQRLVLRSDPKPTYGSGNPQVDPSARRGGGDPLGDYLHGKGV